MTISLDLTPDRLGRPATAEELDTVRTFAREADGIITTTLFLRERLKALNDRIHVVPNALDERLFVRRSL